ncbi:MAG: hypothetical protein QW728_06790 [Thermoplasmata archaeon]
MAGKPKSSQEINFKLKEYLATTYAQTGKSPNMKGLSGQDYIACGLSINAQIFIEGDAGDFFSALNNGARIRLSGNAGRFACDTMSDGLVYITGDTGKGAGFGMSGGVMIVHGNTGAGCGQCMRGGIIIVEGTAGEHAAAMMYGGEIILCGESRGTLGEGMTGGVIYSGSEIVSLSEDVKKAMLSELDIMHLKDIFAKYDIKAEPSNFVKVIPDEEGPTRKKWDKLLEEFPSICWGDMQ